MTPEIVEVTEGHRIALVRGLIEEYAASIGVDLCFQGFDQELATLPGDYRRPGGRLLLALDRSHPAGCVALRPLAPDVCEMKRLYVRPAYRGTGLGQRLVERIVEEGRAAGYERMRLDTLATMRRARALYAELGFVNIPPYRPNPIEGAEFLELDLRARRG
jgi:GNAT superfamily N-acetyltransferase